MNYNIELYEIFIIGHERILFGFQRIPLMQLDTFGEDVVCLIDMTAFPPGNASEWDI